jgi:hypothetical protein
MTCKRWPGLPGTRATILVDRTQEPQEDVKLCPEQPALPLANYHRFDIRPRVPGFCSLSALGGCFVIGTRDISA